MLIKIQDFILRFFMPAVKFSGKLYMPYSRKKINGAWYFKHRDLLEIGDILLSQTKGELTNLLNPVEIPHGALYVGRIKNDGICYVAEALGRGVVLTDLVTFLTTKDRIIISKPTFIRSKAKYAKTIQEAIRPIIGKPYDYMFKVGAAAFYCFELCAYAHMKVQPNLNLKCKSMAFGKKIYDCDTFRDKDFFTIAVDSEES